MQSKKYYGIIRNKTQAFLLSKQSKRKKPSRLIFDDCRFMKQNLLGLNEDISTDVSPSRLKSPLTIQLQKMPTMPTLTPEWIDKYQQCIQIVRSIDDLKKQILTEQSRRLSLIKLSQQKQSERRIYDLTTTVTKKIKQCERILEYLKNQDNGQSQHDRRARNNACASLALTIQQKTKELRNQQKAFIEQRKNIESSTKVSFLQLAASKSFDVQYMDQNFEEDQQLQMELKVNQQRNQQILKIVQSIHELNQLYKELNNLVIVQGSLLDRIDYNIQQSVIHVKKADQTLGRVEQRKKKQSKCSCVVIIILLLIIVIIGIILIVKWS